MVKWEHPPDDEGANAAAHPYSNAFLLLLPPTTRAERAASRRRPRPLTRGARRPATGRRLRP